jgi:hypothetical protein
VSRTTHITDPWIPSEYRQTTGADSLERSAQEDALLFLFITAISNLVRETSHAVLILAPLTVFGGPVPQQLFSEQRYHGPLTVLPVKLVWFRSSVEPITLPVDTCSYHQGVKVCSARQYHRSYPF